MKNQVYFRNSDNWKSNEFIENFTAVLGANSPSKLENDIRLDIHIDVNF